VTDRNETAKDIQEILIMLKKLQADAAETKERLGRIEVVATRVGEMIAAAVARGKNGGS
jgi:hypothetical protein